MRKLFLLFFAVVFAFLTTNHVLADGSSHEGRTSVLKKKMGQARRWFTRNVTGEKGADVSNPSFSRDSSERKPRKKLSPQEVKDPRQGMVVHTIKRGSAPARKIRVVGGKALRSVAREPEVQAVDPKKKPSLKSAGLGVMAATKTASAPLVEAVPAKNKDLNDIQRLAHATDIVRWDGGIRAVGDTKRLSPSHRAAYNDHVNDTRDLRKGYTLTPQAVLDARDNEGLLKLHGRSRDLHATLEKTYSGETS